MLNKYTGTLKITFTTAAGEGRIVLDSTDKNFSDSLRVVEQSLADSHAKDIIYTRYADTSLISNSSVEGAQLSLFGDIKE